MRRVCVREEDDKSAGRVCHVGCLMTGRVRSPLRLRRTRYSSPEPTAAWRCSGRRRPCFRSRRRHQNSTQSTGGRCRSHCKFRLPCSRASWRVGGRDMARNTRRGARNVTPIIHKGLSVGHDSTGARRCLGMEQQCQQSDEDDPHGAGRAWSASGCCVVDWERVNRCQPNPATQTHTQHTHTPTP